MSCSNSFSFSKSAADGEVVASYQLKICLDDIIGKCTVLYWNSKKEIYFHPDDAAICMYSDWLDTLFAGNIEHSSHLKTSSICKHTHNIPCIRTFISALIKTANRSCTIKVIRSIPMILTTAIKKYKLNIQHSSSIENSMYFTQIASLPIKTPFEGTQMIMHWTWAETANTNKLFEIQSKINQQDFQFDLLLARL